MANVEQFRGFFWIFDPSLEEPSPIQEQLWLSLRNYKKDNCRQKINLRLNDIFKLGRCSFIVKEYLESKSKITPAQIIKEDIEEKPKPEHNNIKRGISRAFTKGDVGGAESDVEQDQKKQLKQEKAEMQEKEKSDKEEEIRCRICLVDTNDQSNPLIKSPCKCTGSVQLIHINCLQQWLRSKVTMGKTKYVSSYSWKSFECDVCKSLYPGNIFKYSKIRYNNIAK